VNTTQPAAKPAWERPSLRRHVSGAMNKMGALPALQPVSRIDGVEIEELVAAYGSPLFVYSQRTLEDKVRTFRDALAARWPRVQVCWSYKTCYLDAVCQTFHAQGSWAEAVSGMEVLKARRNGVPWREIVFNGPSKEPEVLVEALRHGAIVHIDHYDELAMVEQMARELGVVPAVGIRVNLATGNGPRWDRFGFNLDDGTAWDAVRRLVGGGALRLHGLHCHLGTFLLDPDVYRQAGRKLAAFANRLRSELGIRLDHLDLGGGVASTAKLKAQYLPGAQVTPSLTQYAEAITDGLSALEGPPDELPKLLVESGRGLVDEAGSLVATVIGSKRLADGRRAVILDAGVNLLYTSTWYEHDIVPTSPVSGVAEPTVFFGPLCMNIDVVREHLLMPPLRTGQRVLIRPVGAYNVTQSMSFIHLQPAVAMVGTTGEHALIRRRQTLDDLVQGEVVPGFVKPG
jgi:diaminopimelate decarboxylase